MAWIVKISEDATTVLIIDCNNTLLKEHLKVDICFCAAAM